MTKEAFEDATHAWHIWQKLLQVTGESLSLNKYIFSFMGWKVEKGEEVHMQLEDKYNIEIQNSEDNLITFIYLEK